MRRILVVDHNRSFCPALQGASLPYTVVVALDGQEAVNLFNSQMFDLVISDMKVPQLDGVELLIHVRSRGNVPFILVSETVEAFEKKELFELGVTEIIVQPLKAEDFFKVIERCLTLKAPKSPQQQDEYCKLSIDDFTLVREIKFNVYAKLSESKYVKIAHKGEDLSPLRLRTFKEKGVAFFYLKQQDFRQYVGFSSDSENSIKKSDLSQLEKKMGLLRKTNEILQNNIFKDGINPAVYKTAATFVETTVDIFSDDTTGLQILDGLNQHADYIYSHSVGVSVFSMMIAHSLSWNLPANRFKVALGGLLHDIGEKEIQKEILMRERNMWTAEDIQQFESHPVRGQEILGGLSSISSDVLQIVYQHHEDCHARGYPLRLTKGSIHPMARLIMVADEFCYRAIQNPNSDGMSAGEALKDMAANCASKLDRHFFDTFVRLFKFSPAAGDLNSPAMNN